MALKDPEKYREYKRQQMARRRAEAKQQSAGDTSPADQNVDTTAISNPLQESRPTPEQPKPLPPKPAKELPPTQEQLALGLSPLKDELNVEAMCQKFDYIMDRQGWVMMMFPTLLHGDIITIIRDEEVTGYPLNHAVYTVEEFKLLCDKGAATFRLVHEAKKKAGAKICLK